MTAPGPLLLAGTRVTGAEPHLGTFYGWIRPIAEAARTMNVVVLIADLQSFDVPRRQPISQQTTSLATALHTFLPNTVSIVRESAIPSLPTLAVLAAPLFARHHWRRIAPLRKLARTGQPVSLATCLYPAMMIANLLAFRATHVLAKPEGQFQHSDALNDVLARAPSRYGWPHQYVTLHPKPRIDIRSTDGTGPMKRDRPGYLPIADATTDSVEAWTANLDTPSPSVSGADRQRRCRVVWPIWQATAAGTASTSSQARRVVEIGHGCVTNEVDCTECTRALVRAITADLDTVRDKQNQARLSTAAAQQAEQYAQHLIGLATGRVAN